MKRLRLLAALAMAALIAAGCSKAPSGAGPGSSGANNISASSEKAVKFAKCMRDNGITGFPDPDSSGQLTVDAVLNGSSVDPNSAAWKQALSACKDLQPPGFTGHKRSAQQQEAALKFAKCMRDNGVSNFPDPTEDGPLISVNGARSIPGFEAAVGKCRALLAGAIGK